MGHVSPWLEEGCLHKESTLPTIKGINRTPRNRISLAIITSKVTVFVFIMLLFCGI